MCDRSYKGEGVVNGSKEKVWECLEPVPGGLRVKWDNNVKKFELLEQVTEVCGNNQCIYGLWDLHSVHFSAHIFLDV